MASQHAHFSARRHVPMGAWARHCAVVLVAMLLWQAPALADSWAAATTTEVFSESREWFVRVVPGKSIGETYGFGGGAIGPHATAEWYRRTPERSYAFLHEITLTHPVAPILFLVTDRGYLVTLDNWHNMGRGTVVASYGPDGKRVAGYELADIFSPAEIAAFRHTVSSIWWRTQTVYVRTGQQSVYIAIDGKGSELIYEPETGRWQYCEQREGAGHLCRTTNVDRKWVPYREPELRKP